MISVLGGREGFCLLVNIQRGSCFLKMEGLDDVQRKEKAKKKGRYMDISVKRLAKTAIANRD